MVCSVLRLFYRYLLVSQEFKISLIILCITQLLFSNPQKAFAENDILIENYNGLTKGRVCWRVDEKELANFEKIRCHYPSSSDLLYTSNNNIFEWSVFQKSADLQVKKNNCLRQKISAIVNDDKLLEQWTMDLKESWLAMKKAELALNKCEVYNQKADMLPRALHFPSFNSRNGLDPKWIKLCSDKEYLNLLTASKDLFGASMPIVSDQEFFDLIGEERSGIINKKTGRPLNDQEILNLDLQDTSNIEFNKKSLGLFTQKIKKKFRELSYERKTLNESLLSKRTRDTKVYALDTATKDFLFEDNTVYETLGKLKLLDTTEVSPGKTPLPMGVKCLMNHYESNDNAELAEFILFTSVSYVGLFKILNLAKLSKLSTLKRGFLSSSVGGHTKAVMNSIQVCSSDLYQKKRTDGRANKEAPDFDLEPLEKEASFKFHDLEIPDKLTPACKGIETDVVVNDFRRSSCLMNALKKQILSF